MKPGNDRDRIVTIAVVFGVVSLVLLCAFAALGSHEIAKLKESIASLSQRDNIDTDELSKKVASLVKIPKPNDGINGKDCTKCVAVDGTNGLNGKDSLSTQTVIERQTNTIIEKELPPQNGKDADPIVLAITVDGRLLWKYESDREWALVPVVEANL